MNIDRIIDGYVNIVKNQNYNYAITLKPNDGYPRNAIAMDSLFHKFHFRLDRKLIGPRFNMPKYDDIRTASFIFMEGFGETAHLHGALKVHESRLEQFESFFPRGIATSFGKSLWSNVMPSGTIKVDEIHDIEGWARYTFKSVSWQKSKDFAYNIIRI